jgi:hypothetical protein
MARRRAFNAGGELVSKTIDSVANGVSQQPPTLRLASQCEAQDNLLSQASDGAVLRPPTEHVTILHDDTLPTAGYKMHIRNRDENTQHLVMISDNDIRVFNLQTGQEAEVDSGVSDVNLDYLAIAGAEAGQAFAITSVADYSFITNKETVVAMSGTVTDPRVNEFMVYLFESVSNKNQDWQHTLGSVEWDDNFNQGVATTVQVEVIRDALIAQIYDQDGANDYLGNPKSLNFPRWTFLTLGKSILHGYQSVGDGSDPIVYDDFIGVTSWGYSDEVYSFIAEQIQKFSDLPPRAPDLFTTEITGSDGNEDNNYWVVYKEEEKAWVETVAPALDNTFDQDTMPHVLIQTSVGGGTDNADEFTFGPQTWATREKGDIDSAPLPSFIGKRIKDVFFHKDRLGFVAEESVVMSESGEFFNFWPTTVTAVIDSDPIDAASTNNRVAFIDYAVPFDEKLYLFSSQGAVQNALIQGGADALTVKSAQVVEVSAFATSPRIKPQPAGKNIYYSVDKGSTSSVSEFFVNEAGPDAEDTTIHVPTYLPANIDHLSVSSKENVLVVQSPDEPNKLFVYSFLFIKSDKVQQAWSTWTFDDSFDFKYLEWIGEVLYLVMERDDGLHLEKMNLATLTDGDLDYRVHLDSQEELTGVYTEGDNKTRWTSVNDVDPDDYGTYQAVLSDDAHTTLGQLVPLTFESGKILWAFGDYSDGPATVGRTYTHTYEFSQPIITAPTEDGRSRASVTQGRLQIGRFKVLVRTSAGFEARVLNSEVNPDETLQDTEEYVYEFPSKYIGQSTVSPAHPVAISEHKFDVAMESKYARIQITGTSHLPFTLVGAEWEGTYTVRASRV